MRLRREDGNVPPAGRDQDVQTPAVIEAWEHEIENGALMKHIDEGKSEDPTASFETAAGDDPASEHSSNNKKTQPRSRKQAEKPKFLYPVEPRTISQVKKRRNVINHSYRDFSRVPPERPAVEFPADISKMSFAQKLHDILSRKEFQDCISWMPHGRAFHVHVPLRFEKVIMKEYFGHCRYSSFLCQLNDHGFKHITRGADRNSHYHECFLRGLPHLCKYMPKRKKARRLEADPENELDFYVISEALPLPDDSNASSIALSASAFPPRLTSNLRGTAGSMQRISPLLSERAAHCGILDPLGSHQQHLLPNLSPVASLANDHAFASHLARLQQVQRRQQVLAQSSQQIQPTISVAAAALAGLRGQSAAMRVPQSTLGSMSLQMPRGTLYANARSLEDLQLYLGQSTSFPGYFNGGMA